MKESFTGTVKEMMLKASAHPLTRSQMVMSLPDSTTYVAETNEQVLPWGIPAALHAIICKQISLQLTSNVESAYVCNDAAQKNRHSCKS